MVDLRLDALQDQHDVPAGIQVRTQCNMADHTGVLQQKTTVLI